MIHTIKLDKLQSVTVNPASGGAVRLQFSQAGIPLVSKLIPVEVAELLASAVEFAAQEARTGVAS